MTGALRKSEDRDGDPLVNPNRFPGSAATRLLLIFLTTSAATAATLSIAVITLQSLTSETQRGASYLILEADLLLLWALAVATYLVHPVIARWDLADGCARSHRTTLSPPRSKRWYGNAQCKGWQFLWMMTS